MSTVQQALREAIPLLAVVTEQPRVEAEILLREVLHISRTEIIAHPERPVPPDALAAFRALVRRRAEGYPLPYLIGRVEFYDLAFVVTPDVFIPRPETEMLVDLALAAGPKTVVDVGTGSGCIAVTLAVHLPQVMVYAVDVSSAALAVAQENVERHGVAERVILIHGDVLGPRPGPVDLVVSNPPYVPTGECSSLPLSVREYEPRLALDGGPDGLAFIRKLLKQSPAVLRPGGRLLIEIGAGQGDEAAYLACTFYPQATIRIHPDLSGRERVLEVQT